MNHFDNWLISQHEGWTEAMEDQYQQEQREKYEQVYKATVNVLGNYGIGVAWNGAEYVITNNDYLLDDVYAERIDAYKAALLLLMQKFHEMKSDG